MAAHKIVGSAATLLAAVALVLTGCEGRQPRAPAADSAHPAKKLRMNGQVRLGDKWTRVMPTVIHEPRMDLRVSCVAKVDEAKKAGKADSILCFKDGFRSADAIAVIRVEVMPGKGTPQQLKGLMAATEAAHFSVDTTGTPYQLLDMGYAARRDGAYWGGEVRILSADDSVYLALTDELRRIFPAAKIQIVTQ